MSAAKTLDDSTDLAAVRVETRAWLEANYSAEMRQPMASEDEVCWGGRHFEFQSAAQRQWLRVIAQRGWTVPAWPQVCGGGGLSGEQAKILAQEMRSLQCRAPLQSFGIWMLGPALQKFGTEAQKLEHLPKIARGEIRWCQGYSEPNAGSDLASLATWAEDRGDHFIVNGQKTWHQLRAVRHGQPGRQRPADPPDFRQEPVLRDVFRQRAGGQAQPGGPAWRWLGRRQVPARARARDDRQHWRPRSGQTDRQTCRSHDRAGRQRSPDRSDAARPDPEGRSRRGLVPAGDEACRRPGPRRTGPPSDVVDAQVLRRRDQQAPLGTDDGDRRSRCAGVGGRAFTRWRRCTYLAAHEGQLE